MVLLRVKNPLLALQLVCLLAGNNLKGASSQSFHTETVRLYVWDMRHGGYKEQRVPLYVRAGCLWWAKYQKNPVLLRQKRPMNLYLLSGYGKHKSLLAVRQTTALEINELYVNRDGLSQAFWRAPYYENNNGIQIVISECV